MDTKDRLAEIEKRKQELALGGGADAIEKQHARGKLSASERIEKLFDPGSFHELYRWSRPLRTGFDIDEAGSPRAGLVTGYGKIEGRTVYAAAYDFTVWGGSQNGMQMVKLARAMEQAREEGVPFVGMVDSGGRQVQDQFGPWGLRPPTRVFGCEEGAPDMFCPPLASGVVPQVSLMLGPCIAGTAYSPIMADFVFFRKGTSFMSLASPALLKSVTFADVTQEEIGGAQLHATTTGSCDFLAETDEEALSNCRRLLGYLPANWKEKPPILDTGDAAGRREAGLLEIIPDDRQPFDMHRVISLMVDGGSFFELAALHAQNMIIGLARLAGQSVGIVANNPTVMDGAIDANACDKAARFIRTCDCFNVPLLFLVDTPGLPASMEMEQSREGIERHAAKPLYAICEATVPKVVVQLRRCYGAGRLVMGTRETGADAVLAWPTAEFRVEAAVPGKGEPFRSGEVMAVDDIIDPRDTRPTVINIFQRLANKQPSPRPARKHGLIPL